MQSCRVRRLMDAVKAGHAAPRQVGRHRLVRGQHEFLDHPVRKVPFRPGNGLDPPLEVQHDLRLGKVEIDAPPPPPLRGQPQCQLLHRIQVGGKVAVAGGSFGVPVHEDLSYCSIGEPLVTADHARVE